MIKNQMSIDQFRKLRFVHQEYTIPDTLWALTGIPCPVRNFRFHPMRKWMIDCAWSDVKLAVEFEGGFLAKNRTIICHKCGVQVLQQVRGRLTPVRLGGAHVSSRYVSDIEKYNALAVHGWTLLRYLPKRENLEEIKTAYSALALSKAKQGVQEVRENFDGR